MKWIFKGIAIGLMIAGFALAFGWVVMWLWNALIPVIFHGPVVTYTQAIGLLILARLLVGRGGWGGGHWRHHNRREWKRKWREKIENMSPEEREKFFAKMKGRCGVYFRDEWQREQNRKAQEQNESGS